ncbi:putative metal-dependent hydrolase, composite domain superfamily [Septoria linicola]|nr:putative metal-dependent hydrolase, composite domain superfamily [Septoria linicola]
MVLKPTWKNSVKIHTDCLFDSKQKAFVSDTTIVVDRDTGLITHVYQCKQSVPLTVENSDIDLRGKCVLPGLVDAHTHIFLHPYSETPSLNQERDESIIERTIRATNHCRAALLAGFTTYRDLGTESAGHADVHVRNAINRGLIPGPRIFCATEALASSGGYEIRMESRINGVETPRLSDPCDGVVGVRAAVRRRLGAGADIIKFYADYRKRALRFPESNWPGEPDIQHAPGWRGLYNDRSPNLLQFNQEEANEIVREARASRAPVAAHAQSAEAVSIAAKAGVTSVEHAFEPWEGTGAMQALKENGVIFVPTLSVLEDALKGRGKDFDKVLAQTKAAFDAGIKLAAGGDTGAVPHGENAKELELLLAAGVPLNEVLTAATLHGWEAYGGHWSGRKFGWLGEGYAADIVALDGDVRENIQALRHVDFVMKDGKVWKKDGQAVGMI